MLPISSDDTDTKVLHTSIFLVRVLFKTIFLTFISERERDRDRDRVQVREEQRKGDTEFEAGSRL